MVKRNKMYSITYECDNCGCETTKEFKKKTRCPQTTECSNCGCVAQKVVGEKPTVTIPFPLPYNPPVDETEPWVKPWETDPWGTGQPWKLPYKRGGSPPNPWRKDITDVTWGDHPDVVRPSVTWDHNYGDQ